MISQSRSQIEEMVDLEVLESNMIPYELQLIVDFLRSANLTAASPINGEGRVASLKDEEVVTNIILNDATLNKFVKKPPPRSCGDILVHTNGCWQPVNVKTTKGTVDNATSKKGIVFSFTSLELSEIPDSLDDKKMFDMIRSNKKEVEGKDYWYLTLNKKNMSEVRAYGLKQIKNWKSNPSNELQINWEKQWQDKSVDLTFEESYKTFRTKWKEIYSKKLPKWDPELLVEVAEEDPQILKLFEREQTHDS